MSDNSIETRNPKDETKKIPKVGKENVKSKTQEKLDNNKDISPIEPILKVVNENKNIKNEDISKVEDDNEIYERFEKAAFVIAGLVALNSDTIKNKFSDILTTLKNFFQVGDSNKDDQPDEAEVNINIDKEIENDKLRSRIVNEAKKTIGSTNFRGKEVDGGNLACAQVVSRILTKAGVLDSEELSIVQTIAKLEEKKWIHKDANHTPKPSDIVIWKRSIKKVDNGHVKLGHGHIGIVMGPDMALSNSSLKRTPRLHKMGRINKKTYWGKDREIKGYMTAPA